MIKKVLLLLICAFTLQLSWGVASAYCMHESGKAERHFGHHAHEHSSPAGGEDGDQGQAKKSLHTDCASCHHHGTSCTASMAAQAAPVLLASDFTPQKASPLPLPYLDLPERPQWLHAA
jgi:hypothetical protein